MARTSWCSTVTGRSRRKDSTLRASVDAIRDAFSSRHVVHGASLGTLEESHSDPLRPRPLPRYTNMAELAFHTAACSGDLAGLQACIASKKDPLEKDKVGCRPTSKRAQRGRTWLGE
jgi:hypothetical protein